MTDYKQRGDGFRDHVANLLQLAGYEAEIEVRADHTKVDVTSLLQRDPFRGTTRIFLETKHTDGNLGADTAAQFVGKYKSLVDRRVCDEAWLVSFHPLTPDAKAAVENSAGLRAMDLGTLQARLMDLGGYLRTLRTDYLTSGVADYYVPPRVAGGGLLEDRVRTWMADSSEAALPLSVIGRYGIGKTTFARHLVAALAAEAEVDPRLRMPVLVPLGEVFDDQSVDGLLGKVLTSRTRVGNYSFGLFEELNTAGRFLIVFDGFDEMKHGLTLSRFERNMHELLRLDRGRAKLLFLGRDTAFHDRDEFDRVVLGRQRTAAGATVPARGRRALEPVHVDDFGSEDVRSFVTRYLPLHARAEARGAPDPRWVEARVAEVLSGGFDGLLARPVHAQMLCDIASRPEAELRGLTKHGLYDRFVHYLMDREVQKRDRAADFGVGVRRRFNAMVAWWLWCRDRGGDTGLHEIPQALVDKAAEHCAHDLRSDELRRALVVGCLVEKGGERFYFSHRSIQEFLVAEHLATTDLLAAEAALEAEEPIRLLSLVTPDIQEFLAQRLALEGGREVAAGWLKALPRLQGAAMNPADLGLFVRAYEAAPQDAPAWAGEPWALFLEYFAANGSCAFKPETRAAYRVLDEARGHLRRKVSEAVYAAALLLNARRLRSEAGIPVLTRAQVVAAWLPLNVLRDGSTTRIHDLYERSGARYQFRRQDDFRLWAFLRAVTSEWVGNGRLALKVDLRRLEADMAAYLNFGFARAEMPVAVLRVDSDAVMRAMRTAGARDFELGLVRKFLNVPGGIEARFQAVDVEAHGVRDPCAGERPSPPAPGDAGRFGRRRRSGR